MNCPLCGKHQGIALASENPAVAKASRVWTEFSKECRFRSDEVGSNFHVLCSNHENTSTVIQNAKGEKNCASCWCPRRGEINKLNKDCGDVKLF